MGVEDTHSMNHRREETATVVAVVSVNETVPQPNAERGE